MADPQHLNRLKQGTSAWNTWRKNNPTIQPDLSYASLSHADLSEINFSGVNLQVVNLFEANLLGANFSEANLRLANLLGANLSKANLSKANLFSSNLFGANLQATNLSGANLQATNLSGANLLGANLSGANLSGATLVKTNLTEATLTNCLVYGIAAWNVEAKEARQNNLVITPPNEPTITVDNLEVAQFIYLLLNNSKIRDIIDTAAKKAVLILGRFTPPRKTVLDALKEALRTHGYVPILFDFDKPASRDLTETVSILAHLARFIIVDLTDPSSAPHEIATVIPHTVVPVQPLLSREPLMVDGRVVERREYTMFQDLKRRHDWVLPMHYYTDQDDLLATLKEQVIAPAEQKAQELAMR